MSRSSRTTTTACRTPGCAPERRLDLAEFDAVAADLDLIVDPAEEVQTAVGAPGRQVAGAVEPGAGRTVGVGDEALGGEPRPAQIASADTGPADVQFTGHADGHRLEPDVQDVEPGVADRFTDRDPAARWALR